VPAVLVPGVITPVALLMVSPAVELKLVALKGPPVNMVTVGLTGATLVQNGLPA
jgi:N-acetyl-gamma-glutamylphosphate reductase